MFVTKCAKDLNLKQLLGSRMTQLDTLHMRIFIVLEISIIYITEQTMIIAVTVKIQNWNLL